MIDTIQAAITVFFLYIGFMALCIGLNKLFKQTKK